MKKVIIIGAGISGLSVGRMLIEAGTSVTIYEKEDRPGGLVKCDVTDGALYHRVGGHVFNSRNKEVLHWFWEHFSQEDFQLANRHAVISLSKNECIHYPIENYLYELPQAMCSKVLDDLIELARQKHSDEKNFDTFLRQRFGDTLYEAYFGPYNRKIWRRPLTDVPLQWLAGKLPMPTFKDIMQANIARHNETQMVHSTFWYPRRGGSQFLADSLARGMNIHYNSAVDTICRTNEGLWIVNGETAEAVIFCGNVTELPRILKDDMVDFSGISQLEAHGTTTVLCSIDKTPYSWVYLPCEDYEAHRIIMTGNFADSNNPNGLRTATIEFSSPVTYEEIQRQLRLIPFNPRYITHSYTPYTYPMQTMGTRKVIRDIKSRLEPHRFFLLGRFAEWEYYNMDAAMEAAMKLCHLLG